MDPHISAFLERVNAAATFDPTQMPLDAALSQFRSAYGPSRQDWPGVSVEDLALELDGRSIPARLYVGQDGPPGCTVVNIHGGGFVGGSLELDDHRCAYLAREAGCAVVSVDYRLAPEHRFPAALDDCKAVFDWTQGPERPAWMASSPVGLLGSSAGGALALATCLMARDGGGPAPAFLVLLYPVVDDDPTRPSYRRFGGGFNLTSTQMSWFFDQYRNDGAGYPESYLAPLRAESFAGLPPTLVLSAEMDVLADEIAELTRRLETDVVLVAATVYGGTIHGFLSIAPDALESRLALKACAAFVGEVGRQPANRS